MDILNSIEAIEKYTMDFNREEFLASVDLQDKVMWRFTIIGEAVNSLPVELKSQYPKVLWQKATDMRNFAVHEYFGIDFGIIWDPITVDLPVFKKQINKILQEIKIME